MNIDDYKKLMAELRKNKDQLETNLDGLEINVHQDFNMDFVTKIQDVANNMLSLINPLKEDLEKFQRAFLGNDKQDYEAFRNFFLSRPDLTNLSDEDLRKIFELYIKANEDDTNTLNRFCCLADETCHNQIIKAHSIQENGELDLISDKRSNKQQVYHLKRVFEQTLKAELHHISNASVFYGMCKDHDREVFKPIDNKVFTSEAQKLLLQSARAFLFSYYRTKVQQIRQLSQFQSLAGSLNIDDECLQIVRFEKQKIELEKAIKENKNILAFLKWSVPHISPIACSSWATIHFSVGSNILTFSNEKLNTGLPIMITVLPSKETNCTYVTLARFVSDIGSEGLFNQLRSICSSHDDFGRLISYIILRCNENFYLNPRFYENLGESERKKIQIPMNDKSPFLSGKAINLNEQINFFEERFKMNRT